MELKDRLKLVRKTMGMSQAGIVGIIGTTQPSWQGYENGLNVPGGKVLKSLAGLGVNVNWLLTGNGPMMLDQNQDTEPITATPDPTSYLDEDPDIFKELIKRILNYQLTITEAQAGMDRAQALLDALKMTRG